MGDPENEVRTYPNPQIETTLVEGFPVIIAEVSNPSAGRYRRTHRRIIGAEDTEITGRPIIYSDTYADAPGSPVYAYARYDVDQVEFSGRLEDFLTMAILVDFPELQNRKAQAVLQTRDEINEVEFPEFQDQPAQAVLQTRGEINEVEFASYLVAVRSLRSRPLEFARLYFPFGDMTVDFGPQAFVVKNELDCISREMLSPTLEAPLFALDASRSEVWLNFLMTIHWARNLVEPAILRSVLGMAAGAYV
jgi:hypothetical protein